MIINWKGWIGRKWLTGCTFLRTVLRKVTTFYARGLDGSSASVSNPANCMDPAPGWNSDVDHQNIHRGNRFCGHQKSSVLRFDNVFVDVFVYKLSRGFAFYRTSTDLRRLWKFLPHRHGKVRSGTGPTPRAETDFPLYFLGPRPNRTVPV